MAIAVNSAAGGSALGERLRLELPDPALTDGGVLLRPWRDADATSLAEVWADTEIRRWMAVPEPTPTEARRWIAGDQQRRAEQISLDLVVCAAADPTVVHGEVGISHIDPARRAALIGYWVAPSHRGRGLARRALGLVSEWALDRAGLQALVARCAPANRGSIATARACGYQQVGTDADKNIVLVRRSEDEQIPPG